MKVEYAPADPDEHDSEVANPPSDTPATTYDFPAVDLLA